MIQPSDEPETDMHPTILLQLATDRMAELRAEAAGYRLRRSLRRPRTRTIRQHRNGA